MRGPHATCDILSPFGDMSCHFDTRQNSFPRGDAHRSLIRYSAISAGARIGWNAIGARAEKGVPVRAPSWEPIRAGKCDAPPPAPLQPACRNMTAAELPGPSANGPRHASVPHPFRPRLQPSAFSSFPLPPVCSSSRSRSSCCCFCSASRIKSCSARILLSSSAFHSRSSSCIST